MLKIMKFYQDKTTNAGVALYKFQEAGSQSLAEFWVKDLNKPETNAYNLHMQNVSQWLYAGAILVADGKVSTHH